MSNFLAISLETNAEIIIWSICIGVNLAFIISFISKNVIGKLVRTVIKNAYTEDSAKTLSELCFKVNLITKYLLRYNSSFLSVISVKGDVNKDVENARLYIKESNVSKAKAAYGEQIKWYFLPLFIILSVGCSYIMAIVMPILMNSLGI